MRSKILFKLKGLIQRIDLIHWPRTYNQNPLDFFKIHEKFKHIIFAANLKTQTFCIRIMILESVSKMNKPLPDNIYSYVLVKQHAAKNYYFHPIPVSYTVTYPSSGTAMLPILSSGQEGQAEISNYGQTNGKYAFSRRRRPYNHNGLARRTNPRIFQHTCG